MNKYSSFSLLLLLSVLFIPLVSGAPTTNLAIVNISSTNIPCVVFTGTTSFVDSVYFDYGHINNTGFSASTLNQTKSAGCWSVSRCNEPTFLPGETYRVRACGKTTGCGLNVTFTMPALVPHALETFSQYGTGFIDNGGDPSWLAAHIWDVYSMTWGSYFLLILIGFIFMNVTIKQKSITISFLLMLISGGFLWAFAPPALVNIAQILMAIALAGLIYWLYKGRR